MPLPSAFLGTAKTLNAQACEMGQSQTDRAANLSLALAGCELLFTSFCSPKERTRITVLTSEHYCEN